MQTRKCEYPLRRDDDLAVIFISSSAACCHGKAIPVSAITRRQPQGREVPLVALKANVQAERAGCRK
eukprot:4998102-Amphidinium_carterae.1